MKQWVRIYSDYRAMDCAAMNARLDAFVGPRTEPYFGESDKEMLKAYCAEASGDLETSHAMYESLWKTHGVLAARKRYEDIDLLRAQGLSREARAEIMRKAKAQSGPRPIKRQPPSYPFSLAFGRVEGRVTLSFSVSAEGDVNEIAVVDSDPPFLFDLTAVKALSHWKYERRMEEGLPVGTENMQVDISFALED